MVARTKPNEIYLTRVYDAPAKTVWDASTDPDHLSKWQPPVGFDMEFIRADFRDGGNCFFKMSNQT